MSAHEHANADTRSRDLIRNLFARLLHDEPSADASSGPKTDGPDDSLFADDPFGPDPFGRDAGCDHGAIDGGSILHLGAPEVGSADAEATDPFGNPSTGYFCGLGDADEEMFDELPGGALASLGLDALGISSEGDLGKTSYASGDGATLADRFELSESAAFDLSAQQQDGPAADAGAPVSQGQGSVPSDRCGLRGLPERPPTGTHRVATVSCEELYVLNEVLSQGWRVIQMLGCGEGGFVVALRYAGYAA